MSFLIDLRLKIAALLRESVEIGIVLAPVNVSLRLELILLLLVSCTPTLRMYLGIVEKLAPVCQCSLEGLHFPVCGAEFVAPRLEKLVELLLFAVKSVKALLRPVRN